MFNSLQRERPTFTNWAGNQTCTPARRSRPTTAAEVADLVRAAWRDGLQVKAVGAGHSFTDAACTTGVLVHLDAMDQVMEVDRDTGLVRVQAGIRLSALNESLAALGLAMPNLGDIAYQSVAGAIATATHGTGRRLGNLATTVVGMELVTGTGEIVRADADENAELLRVARVGLGALGIVTEVTLACVPRFDLHVIERREDLDDILANWLPETEANDHVEFFWFPGTDRVQVKRNNRTDRPADPPSRLSQGWDKYVIENAAFGAMCRIGRRFPRTIEPMGRFAASAIAERDLVDRSDRVFASPRLVHFREMEYGIPLADLPEALLRVRDLVGRLGMPNLFPVEVRCSAADDIPLSTANGRESAWIAAHVYAGMPYDAYFAGVEAIMNDYDGRPHWGKMHFQNAASLAGRYPEWNLFARTRAELDPDGIFANAYLDRVLGPVRRPIG